MFYFKEFIDCPYSLYRHGCIRTFYIFRWCINKLSANTWLAETLCYTIHLIISSIGIRMKISLKAFKEYLWVLSASLKLILKESYWILTMFCSAVYPYIKSVLFLRHGFYNSWAGVSSQCKYCSSSSFWCKRLMTDDSQSLWLAIIQ